MLGLYWRRFRMRATILSFWMLTSCSLQSLTLEVTGDLLSDAAHELETEQDFELFRESVPGMIKTVEGLAFVDPQNQTLLAALVKAYAGYGFGVFETLHLHEKLADADKTPMKRRALGAYSRAVRYGLRLFQLREISVKELMLADRQGRLGAELERSFDHGQAADLDSVFFLAQSWLGLINLQRDRPELIAQISLVKGLVDWVCHAQPDFQQGACSIFAAAYEASRPAMLGGHPEDALRLFEEAIVKYPNNLLIRVAFLEYYVLPRFDKNLYLSQKRVLSQALAKAEQFQDDPETMDLAPSAHIQKGQLFNTIALQRFRIIRHYENEIF